MIETLQGDLGVYAGTMIICFIGGLVPLVNTEIYIVAATRLLITSDLQLPALVALAAGGQMVAKVLLYYTAAGALRLPTGRYQAKLDAARARIESWRSKPKLILFVSALFSIPPFYVVSLLAGALGIRIRSFIVIGFAGRLLHFAAIVVAVHWL